MSVLSTQALGVPTAQTAPAIWARSLSKWIDGRPVLSDISLTLSQGRFMALLGANGAGKSTLLKLFATLTPPTGGQLQILGQPLQQGGRFLRTRIGLIGHQAMLYRDLSARENLLFFAKLYGVDRPKQRVEALLAQVGMADRANDPVKTFSRGMVQRTAIARAMVHEPELLLADEPFAGLDAPSCQTLEALLHELHQTGKSVLLASHDSEHFRATLDTLFTEYLGEVVSRLLRRTEVASASRA